MQKCFPTKENQVVKTQRLQGQLVYAKRLSNKRKSGRQNAKTSRSTSLCKEAFQHKKINLSMLNKLRWCKFQFGSTEGEKRGAQGTEQGRKSRKETTEGDKQQKRQIEREQTAEKRQTRNNKQAKQTPNDKK